MQYDFNQRYTKMPGWHTTGPMPGTRTDPIVDRVLKKVSERSAEGMRKYGVTMERPDVTTVQWLRHAQEEALDLAVYLERVIDDLTKAA